MKLFLFFFVCCTFESDVHTLQEGPIAKNFGMKWKRAFHETPYGQIHYKFGGDFGCADSPAACYTFLLFHGNPRSSDEFTELIQELTNRFADLAGPEFSFIAMDMLGEGHSDDPVMDTSSNYVSMEQYTEYMLEIASEVFETGGSCTAETNRNLSKSRYIVPLGSLTGTAIAVELSYQLRLQNGTHLLCKVGSCRVLTTILHDPMYYFSEEIVANVRSYASEQQKWQPKEDGQHLVDIWNDLNYQPYKNLSLQDRKSLDRFRAAKTQWQVILSYADYSSQVFLSRLESLSKPSLSDSDEDDDDDGSIVPLIVVYGGEFLNDPMMDKYFQVQKMRDIIANATEGGSYETVVSGGNQALLSQNVTVIADIIMEQLKT